MQTIESIDRSWIMVSGYGSTELAEVWMLVEFSGSAFFVNQHQASSIQHLLVNGNGFQHIGPAK